jgi:hypothetical protein
MLVFSFPKLSGFLSVNNKNQVVRWLIVQRTVLKTRAIKEQKPYILRVDISDNRFQTLPMPGAVSTADQDLTTDEDQVENKSARQKYVCSGDLDITAVVLPDDEIILSGAVDIIFSEKGYSQQAIIQMKDGDDRFSIYIEPFLPRVVVYEGHVKFEQLWKELS